MGGQEDLSTFTADTTSKLDVLWHNGDTLGVDGAQVGVLKETDKISFAGFLKGHDSGRLEAKISLEVLSDFTDKTLEGQLADEQFSRFLVTTDFSKSDGTRAVTMRLLDTTGSGGTLTSSLGGKLLTRSLASGRFTGSLLSTSHCDAFGITFFQRVIEIINTSSTQRQNEYPSGGAAPKRERDWLGNVISGENSSESLRNL